MKVLSGGKPSTYTCLLCVVGMLLSSYALYVEHKTHRYHQKLKEAEENSGIVKSTISYMLPKFMEKEEEEEPFKALCDIEAIGASCRYVIIKEVLKWYERVWSRGILCAVDQEKATVFIIFTEWNIQYFIFYSFCPLSVPLSVLLFHVNKSIKYQCGIQLTRGEALVLFLNRTRGPFTRCTECVPRIIILHINIAHWTIYLQSSKQGKTCNVCYDLPRHKLKYIPRVETNNIAWIVYLMLDDTFIEFSLGLPLWKALF